MKMKVRCVGYKRNEQYFTKGKIYTWEDGKLVNDIGFTYNNMVSGKNIDDWSLSNWYKFKKVEDNEDKMTDEEIFGMLKDKLKKNGIPVYTFTPEMIKVVSLAYRAGYGRGSKGRPFKYANIKPAPKFDKYVVDSNGNKIYYNDDEVVIGDKVVFISHDGSKDDVWPEYGRVGCVVKYANPEGQGLFVKWEGRSKSQHNWREYCKKVVE